MSAPLWTGLALVGALAARVSGRLPASVSGVSIDTRTIEPGELFFAIKGENNDGHDYVNAAFESGAAACVIDEAHADALVGKGAFFVVDDTLAALRRLGHAARERSHAQIVAVTGSVGKTSTKETLRTVLATRACATLGEAILYSTYPEIGSPAERRAFEAVRDRVRLTRYGFDCYGYALVALGHVDLVIEAGLQPYDIAGPQAVIEAAGGVVTDWQGRSPHHGGRVLAAGDARVHAAALELLAQAG